MSDITIPTLDVLEDVAAELARCASGAGDRVNARALNNAAFKLRELHAIIRFSAGDLLVPSANTAGVVYRVSGAGCSCQAGAHGSACWHSAMAEIVLVARERLADADTGDTGADDGYRAFDAYAPDADADMDPYWCDGPLPLPTADERAQLARRITAARAVRWQVAA